MRFSVSLKSQRERLEMQMGFRRVPRGGGFGFRGAWKCLGVGLVLEIALAVLQNASAWGLQSVPETQSKKAETKIEGKVCTAAGAAIAEALVSLANEAEERVA